MDKSTKRKVRSESMLISNFYKSPRQKKKASKILKSRQQSAMKRKRAALEHDRRTEKEIALMEEFLSKILFIPTVLIKLILEFSVWSKKTEEIYYFCKLLTPKEFIVVPMANAGGNIWILFYDSASLILYKGIFYSSSNMHFNLQLIENIEPLLSIPDGNFTENNLHVHIRDRFFYVNLFQTIWIVDLAKKLFCIDKITLQIPNAIDGFPYSIDVFKVSNLSGEIWCYIQDFSSKNLCVFSGMDGKLLKLLNLKAKPGIIVRPFDIHLDDISKNVYLLDRYYTSRIWVMNRENGIFYHNPATEEWLSYHYQDVDFKRSNKYKLTFPTSLLLHADYLYVNNNDENIQIFSACANTLGTWITTLWKKPERCVYEVKMCLATPFLYVIFSNSSNIYTSQCHIYKIEI